jgi:hypothetical protein
LVYGFVGVVHIFVINVIKDNKRVNIYRNYQKINYQNVKENKNVQVVVNMDKMGTNFVWDVCCVKIKEMKQEGFD